LWHTEKHSNKSKKQNQQPKFANEEKERTMDGLLMHYIKKQSPHLLQHNKGQKMVRRTTGHVRPSMPDYDYLSTHLEVLVKTTHPA